MRIFTTLDEVAAAAGEELGTTDWLTIDQERVDRFAEATGDHQWIHVDVERAAGRPVRRHHRPRLPDAVAGPVPRQPGVLDLETPGAKLNYGAQQGPLPEPGPGRLADPRATCTLRRGHRPPRRQAADPAATSIEIEGEAKPACVAETVVLLLP